VGNEAEEVTGTRPWQGLWLLLCMRWEALAGVSRVRTCSDSGDKEQDGVSLRVYCNSRANGNGDLYPKWQLCRA
jgi:hypothetical protein